MSTLKSSAEDLTLNADGSGNDIILQSNGSTVGTLTAEGVLTATSASFSTADNSDTLTLTSTDADADGGPNLKLYRNTASAADYDIMGEIDFIGVNDANQDVQYGTIRCFSADVTDGTEDAELQIRTMHGGTSYSRIASGLGAVVINDDSQDVDFIVESDSSATAFVVDGGTNDVTIGAGDLIFGTAGKGICLGVTTNTDANTLDDYEEGTWTATVSAGSISSQNCSYTKIGRSINLRGSVAYGGSGSDAASMGGIPFTQGSKPVAGACFAAMISVSEDGMVMVKMNASNSTLYVYSFKEASIQSAFQNEGELYFDITYEE